MSKREKATKAIIKWVEEIYPGGGNKKIYEDYLGKMTDKEFDTFMGKLKTGEETLFLIAPNFNKVTAISVERNLEIAEKIGHDFFERLWLTDPATDTTYLTPIPYMVVDLPLRRQAQTLNKKISIPENNDHVDDIYTGQPTSSGPSRGAKLSYPELQTLYAQGADKMIEEVIRFRGGDEDGFRQMNQSMIETGSVKIDSIQTKGRVKSTETLSTLLKAAHIDNTV